MRVVSHGVCIEGVHSYFKALLLFLLFWVCSPFIIFEKLKMGTFFFFRCLSLSNVYRGGGGTVKGEICGKPPFLVFCVVVSRVLYSQHPPKR